eukprot:scaffold131998_cov26-Prasinocladus_malaysianus.AAC.1
MPRAPQVCFGALSGMPQSWEGKWILSGARSLAECSPGCPLACPATHTTNVSANLSLPCPYLTYA